MKCLKELEKIIILFSIGGVVYMLMEIIFRGYTHWTMGVVGGLCFIIIGGFNNYIKEDWSIIKQGIAGSLIITSFELISGIVLNLFLNLHVWDYSNMPFNFLGQICLPFSIIWIFISMFAIVLDDFLRTLLFNERFPSYKLK